MKTKQKLSDKKSTNWAPRELNWGGLLPTERRSCYICGRTEDEVNQLLKEAMWEHEKETGEKIDFIDIQTASVFCDMNFPTIKIEMADRKKEISKTMVCNMDMQVNIVFRFPLCPICELIYFKQK